MRRILVVSFLLLAGPAFAQPGDAIVSVETVTRIVRTLSDDSMMGRPAAHPELIEPAAAFIEREFERIGLSRFPGLKTYRQEFEKERVSPTRGEVTVGDTRVPAGSYLIIADQASVNRQALPVKYVADDAGVQDKQQLFFSKVSAHMRDTASLVVVVDPVFKEGFEMYVQYFRERFTSGRKNVKVLVLGNYEGKTASVVATQHVRNIAMANIVGMLEGKSRKDEYVIFSAHYDHIGIRPAVNGDSIANGADDDASGTTAVILLAEHFRNLDNNERSLIFVAFTAEEIGGFGSKYFSEQLDPDKIVAMFNIEMIGKPSKWGKDHAFMTGYERSNLGEIINRNLEGTSFRLMPDPYPQQNLFYRSDNATLARLGVPAHTISTDQIDSDKLYHTVDDEFESLDVENMVAAIRSIALGSRSIISGADTPSRIDKATVR